ncbi:FAD-dependent oxidoreductase [Panacibacter microcysteis]|uniref:FAD-dependent oxidoreductase n=1 Tax=Panacibacter microcysteis TaxID=2793269 RepID=UPI0018CBE5C8
MGGGNAGISAAAQLLNRNKGLDICIIEPSDKHYYQPAWTLAGAGVFDIEKTQRNEADFIPSSATWIKQKVKLFFPEKNQVALDNGETIVYDYMIVVPGIQLNWSAVKGLQESLGKHGVCSNYNYKTAPYTFECIKNLKKGKALFTNPHTPVKVAVHRTK